MRKKKQRRLLYELLLTQYETTMESQAGGWVLNLRRNAPYVHHSVAEFGTGNAETCLIFAPGASLSQYEKRIRELDNPSEFYIVGCPTALRWMMQNKIKPHCVFAADRHDDTYRWLNESRWRGPVIMPTSGNPKVAAHFDTFWWNDRTSRPGYKPLIDAVVQTQYPELPSFQSMSHVTGATLQILMELTHAGKTKFKRFVLVGADYSFWHDMPRLPLTEDGSSPNESLPEQIAVIDGIKTDYRMIFYIDRMNALMRANPQMWVYSFSEGLLKAPYVGMSDLLHHTYPLPRTEKELIATQEEFLLETMPTILLPLLIDEIPLWKRIVNRLFGGNNAVRTSGLERESHEGVSGKSGGNGSGSGDDENSPNQEGDRRGVADAGEAEEGLE